MNDAINTHGMVMQFGRHKGELYTRVPVSYLRWMVQSGHQSAAYAEAELKRRGTPLPTVDVSGHAIDRASLTCRKIWHHNHHPDEGFYSWLCRMTEEAIQTDIRDNAGRHLHNGMKLAIDIEGRWPVLKTVMPDNQAQQEDHGG